MGEVIYAEHVRALKKLREETSLGLAACRKALEDHEWNYNAAKESLVASSSDRAQKVAEREAHEGKLVATTHNGRIGALVEINCETDFAAKTNDFNTFCDHVIQQIVGASPLYLDESDIPENDMTAKANEIHGRLPLEASDDYAEQFFEQKFNEWYKEVCLLEQEHVNPFLKSKTIEQLRQEVSAKLGENIVIRRFVRWELTDISDSPIKPM